MLKFFHVYIEYNILYFILSTDFDSFYKLFSFIDSIEFLLKFDKHSQLNSLHGIKVLLMTMNIIYIHKLILVLQNPINNSKLVESVSQENIFE